MDSQPEIIPWNRNTFPDGMLYIRQKVSDEAMTPDGILNKGIRIGTRVVQWDDLYRNFTWSRGHHPVLSSWKTCGVEQ